MEQIALIAGEHVIYGKNLMLTAATICAVLWFFSLYAKDRRTLFNAFLAVPLMLLVGILVSRTIHWYCHPSNYVNFKAAILDLSTGDFALIGVFFSVLAVVGLLKLLRVVPDAGQMLDSAAIAGAGGIGVGRLASLFDTSCRGPMISTFRLFPLIYPMTDPVSGQTEYRLATFLLQAAAAWIIFALLLILRARNKRLKGDLWLIFLVLYGATQVVLDSTRYDPLSFRSNGFISIVQAMSAAALVFAAIIFSVRMVRTRGLKPWAFGLWLGILGCLGGVGYMEYYVQRHGYKAVFAYSCMSLCLILAVTLILTVRRLSLPGHRSKREEQHHLERSNSNATPRRFRRTRFTVIASAAVLALVLLVSLGLMHGKYTLVSGKLVSRTASELDLRGKMLTIENYRSASEKLPNARIIWDVPFQGRRLSSDSTRISVSSLSAEDVDALSCFPQLTLLDARKCTDYESLAMARERYPACSVIYFVPMGGVDYPCGTRELTVDNPSSTELKNMIPFLPDLASVNLTGTLPEADELYALEQEFPHILFHWDLATGGYTMDDSTTELDLRGTSMTADQIGTVLEYLPVLERVDLRGTSLTDPEIRALADRFPECFFLWELRFGDFRFFTDSEEIDISGMELESTQAVEEILPYFPMLKRVIMSHCGLDNETMAALDAEYEDVRFVWTVQFRNKYVRTDETFFYPVKLFNSQSVYLNDEEIYPLRYCVDMICIDIGHQFGVTNCEWAAFMPNLEYLIIGETNISDLTPLSSCKKLKYLEMFTIPVEDYSPLVECTGLEDLNLGKTYCDPAPIAKMTWLKNLWWCGVYGTVGKIYSNAHIILGEALPNTNMKFYLDHPVAGGWRQLENYYAMRDILGMFYLT